MNVEHGVRKALQRDSSGLTSMTVETEPVCDLHAGSSPGSSSAPRGHPAIYSGSVSPEPPNSFGKSLSFGSPSRMRNTVSW